MTGFFLTSQILLWIAILVLGVLVAALARQVGVLHERIAPAGALTLHQKVNVGDKAPAMTLDTLEGKKVAIGGKRERRGQLIFFLSPDCPVCKTLLPVVRSASSAERGWLDVVLASDGDAAAHRRLVMAEGLSGFDYVLSEDLGRSFGVSKLPYAVLIDEEGNIASLGLVNNREHLESLFEAKERRVASIQEYLARG
ncbi:methylamine dehydrogenase [Sphingopyxis sp. Root214]|uniref:redoxin family protein n=1 Tax=unclassified Sphingopyxis TaxID=2614943 RepID=UPI0006F628D8|nr:MULTISPECIES: redoxin family protein [unclassified Sphingopyxis]KQZ73783.1 methylamine dehydrogenase [Sphingopyxis sp. Root154]KRC07924.1 methylamine dehydrogenase [Sphingopyxis sp. Root214]